MLRFKVTALTRAEVGSRLQVVIDEPRLKLGPDLTADYLHGTLTLTRTDRHILLEGTLNAAVLAECVRCLDAFQQPLQFQFEEQFTLTASRNAIESALFVETDGTIDLTFPMREQILLTQPIQPLCRPGCKGLCAQCGKNLNEGPCNCSDDSIDPRLASFRTLL